MRSRAGDPITGAVTFDPTALPDPPFDVAPLVELLDRRRALVLTGAGCSTESGIPDYRGPQTRKRNRNPIQYLPFVRKAEVRSRYWARSAVGWPRMRAACPNRTHHAIAALEESGRATCVLTQNVDGLHQAAGSHDVIELHGALSRVVCLDCLGRSPRDELQEQLRRLNPGWPVWSADYAPDGDAELGDVDYGDFVVPNCPCGGTLKPDVVFFGENVPRARVDASFAALDEADALLVVGSSLTVWSGYRFVRKAKELGKPIAIVTLGETRGDAEADVRIHARCGAALEALTAALPAPSPRIDSVWQR